MESTDNQYFIATHSAHFLDMPGVSIFHVHLENGQTVVEKIISDHQKSEICDDLGYRASDLLQTNCIIWVEGPSDRIYLNHWIRTKDSGLTEGIHYSIMFYGGRLLSHLAYDDKEVDEFITLQRLNRHSAILIDSDKRKTTDEINQTKKRIMNEFTQGNGFVWITEGKEIENYIHKDILTQAMKSLYGDEIEILNSSRHRNVIEYKDRNSKKKLADKIKLAHNVSRHPAEFDVLNLGEKVDELIAFVKQSNGQ